MNKLFFLISALVLSLSINAQSSQVERKADSVEVLINLSNDSEKFELLERLSYAKEARKISIDIGKDSLILKSGKRLASLYLANENYNLYRRTNYSNRDLSIKLRDSSSLALAYQNLAWYHYIESSSDSSYYYYFKARSVFNRLGSIQYEAEVLLNMADIQETERDYLGSENNAIESIKLIKTLPQDENNLDTLWSLYNLLGIISDKMQNYDKSLEYHEEALKISHKMSDGYINEVFSLHNKAIVYRELKEFDTSIKYYNDLLNDEKLNLVSPETYALYLNNYANVEYLSGDFNRNKVLNNYWKSLKVCDSLDYDFGMISVSKHLLEYYVDIKDKDSAIYYGKRTLNLAKETSANDVVLEALKLLSEVDESDKGKAYLVEHIRLSDSLIHNERSIRDKFGRIEFETDQIKAENVQISKERLIFLVSSVGLFVTLVLLYVIISQRVKNKALEFNKAQQEANEEIYNLMLAQQDKVDEGRTQEKKRISEELHDGILGRLFGTRLSLDSLNFVHTDDAVKTRSQYIDELKSIEQEIRKISHDLNTDFVSGSSFSDIIQALIENQTNAYQLTYDYFEDDDIDWDELSNKTKIHVYRMLQETMQNIYKHANANHIKISFQLKNNVILLTVEDDGTGFNTNKARKGIGLKNFDSRANEIGGKVEIFSNLGEGTKVVIHVPTE